MISRSHLFQKCTLKQNLLGLFGVRWGLEAILEVTEVKNLKPSTFYEFSIIILFIFGFNEILKRDLENLKKKLGEYFQWLYFLNRLLTLSKCAIVYLICFTLIFAWTYLQLPLEQWGAGNVYLLVLSSWKVNIAENPIAVMEL